MGADLIQQYVAEAGRNVRALADGLLLLGSGVDRDDADGGATLVGELCRYAVNVASMSTALGLDGPALVALDLLDGLDPHRRGALPPAVVLDDLLDRADGLGRTIAGSAAAPSAAAPSAAAPSAAAPPPVLVDTRS